MGGGGSDLLRRFTALWMRHPCAFACGMVVGSVLYILAAMLKKQIPVAAEISDMGLVVCLVFGVSLSVFVAALARRRRPLPSAVLDALEALERIEGKMSKEKLEREYVRLIERVIDQVAIAEEDRQEKSPVPSDQEVHR